MNVWWWWLSGVFVAQCWCLRLWCQVEMVQSSDQPSVAQPRQLSTHTVQSQADNATQRGIKGNPKSRYSHSLWSLKEDQTLITNIKCDICPDVSEWEMMTDQVILNCEEVLKCENALWQKGEYDGSISENHAPVLGQYTLHVTQEFLSLGIKFGAFVKLFMGFYGVRVF